MDTKLKLEQLLEKHKVYNSKHDIDAVSHAINDIEEASNKIAILIKKLKECKDRESFVDVFFDLKDELNHIDYHLKDSKILE